MATTPTLGDDPVLDAETKVPVLVGVSIAFVLASSAVVALRLYTRHFIVAASGLEEILITITTAFSILVSVLTILQTQHGLGRHTWVVSDEDTMIQLKCLYASMFIYNASQILTKLSFLMLYRRIFIDKLTQTMSLVMIIFLCIWGVAQEVFVGLSCQPMSLIFPEMAQTCILALAVWYLTSIANIITDFCIFAIPIPSIIKLRLPRQQKAIVAVIFGLGFFTCIISIVRLFTIASAVNTTDPSWDNVPTSWWSVVELNCGIICASLPTLGPFLRHVTGKETHTYGNAYQKQSEEPSSGGGRSHAAYALHTMEASGSQEGLKEYAADPRDCAESIESGTTPKAGPSDQASEEALDLHDKKKGYQSHAAVTTDARGRLSQLSAQDGGDSDLGRQGIVVVTRTTQEIEAPRSSS